MVAPVSVCLITRDDPHVIKCIQSFYAFVKEVVVVVTSSNDLSTLQELHKLKETAPCNIKIDTFDDCNVNGKITDFSKARNYSLSLATQPWLMWIDSDDTITGLENLESLCVTPPNGVDGTAYLFPYEYAYDDNKNCITKHYRERLFYGKDNFHFTGVVHEVLVPNDNKKCAQFMNETIIFKHQRQYLQKTQEAGRNLRILQDYFANGGKNPREMYYMGLEYSNNGNFPNAIKYLTEYVGVSGWHDERAMAMQKLVYIYQTLNDYHTGLNWAFQLMQIKPDWFEAYFAAMRMFYFLNDWRKCVHFGEMAENCNKTQTVLFVDEAERFQLHIYLNVAYNNIGKIQEALDSCNAGLKGLPKDTFLLNNKRLLERELGIKHPVTTIKGTDNHLGIVFVTQKWGEDWSPVSAKEKGIGGSETMLIHQARNLASLGHHVHVYAACQGLFDGVHYHTSQDFHDIECDVLIVSRYAQYLGEESVSAKLKLLWCHDVQAINSTNNLLLKADRILALSQWHKDLLVKQHNLHPDHVLVTRNGIDLNRFNQTITKDQFKCVNSSSPDRSWAQLFQVWPEIKKQVPQATLHLFYGFANWRAMNPGNPVIAQLEEQAKTLNGVVFHDRINQDELAKEFCSANAWVYPTWFSETSCISAMEAQAANLHIITSPIAALNETCANYNKTVFIPGDCNTREYQQKFIEATVKALNEQV